MFRTSDARILSRHTRWENWPCRLTHLLYWPLMTMSHVPRRVGVPNCITQSSAHPVRVIRTHFNHPPHTFQASSAHSFKCHPHTLQSSSAHLNSVLRSPLQASCTHPFNHPPNALQSTSKRPSNILCTPFNHPLHALQSSTSHLS